MKQSKTTQIGSLKDWRTYALWIIPATVFLLAFTIPLFMDDGTTDLAGEQKRAAKAVLDPKSHELQPMDTFLKFRFILKTRAESVYRTPDNIAKSWCGGAYQEGKTYYSVVVAEYTFFGIKVNEGAVHDACILL